MVMNWHITFGRKAILSDSKQVKTALMVLIGNMIPKGIGHSTYVTWHVTS